MNSRQRKTATPEDSIDHFQIDDLRMSTKSKIRNNFKDQNKIGHIGILELLLIFNNDLRNASLYV